MWQEKKRLKSQSQYYVFVDQVSQIDHAESLSMIVPPKEQKARDMDAKTKLDTLKTKQTRTPRVRTRSRPTDATSSATDPQVYL